MLAKKNFAKSKIKIKDLNWLADDIDLTKEIFAKVRLRSTQKEADAIIKIAKNNEAIVEMKDQTRAITPGQACVIYDDDRVLVAAGLLKKYLNFMLKRAVARAVGNKLIFKFYAPEARPASRGTPTACRPD